VFDNISDQSYLYILFLKMIEVNNEPEFHQLHTIPYSEIPKLNKPFFV